MARALADWVIPAENPAGTILGLILIGALLAAESGRRETYRAVLLSSAIAAVLYWVAHSYAGVLGARLTERRRLTVGALMRALAHDVTMIRGAAVPLIGLVVAAIAGASRETAVTVGVWSAIVSLFVFELLAGLRSGASRGELVLETCVGAAMGLGILALKVTLHTI